MSPREQRALHDYREAQLIKRHKKLIYTEITPSQGAFLLNHRPYQSFTIINNIHSVAKNGGGVVWRRGEVVDPEVGSATSFSIVSNHMLVPMSYCSVPFRPISPKVPLPQSFSITF